MRLKMGISGLSDLELKSKAQFVHDHLDPALFPAPPVTLVVFQAAITQYADDIQNAMNRDTEMVSRKRAQRIVVENFIRQIAGYVYAVSAGNPLIIEAGGFEVVSPRTPSEVLPGTVLKAEVSGFPGAVMLRMVPLKGCKSWSIEYTLQDPANIATQWTFLAECTKGTFLAEGFQPGTIVWFRCYGVNSKGRGMPSDPAKSVVGL